MVLRLTLLVWQCFALIREIAGDSPKTCSREAMYGGYLHDIAHAPTQLSVVYVLSCYREALERIQGQAKAVALACTNRRHQDVPLQVLTRLQLRSQNAERGASGMSKVSKAAAALPSPLPPPPPRPSPENKSLVSKRQGSPAAICTSAKDGDDQVQVHMNRQRPLLDGASPVYSLYGDPAYPVRAQLLAPHRGVNLTQDQILFNSRVSAVRVTVDYGFQKVLQQFAFLDFKKNLKILLQAVGRLYVVGVLLTNCHTCLYGSQTSRMFDLSPPSLEKDLQLPR